MRAIALSSKLRASAYHSANEMVFTQKMQLVDRELYLELAESSINPAFIHMSSPIPNGCDPFFYLKINGEALWKWQEFKIDPTQISVSCTSEWFGVNRLYSYIVKCVLETF